MNSTYMVFSTRSTESTQPAGFFSLLRQFLPKACPKEFHKYETEPIPFTEANIDRFVEFWWSGRFFWSAKRQKVYGVIFLGTAHYPTGILHYFETSLAGDNACREFLIEGARRLHADYAFTHALGDPPFSPDDSAINDARGGDLQLPPVPWAVCYGKPYLELFGKENLLSLPVQQAREVGPDLVFCQLTSRLLDAVENNELIQERREAVYQCLGRDAFFDPRDPDREGRVPHFQEPIVVRPEQTAP
jgi:hypothetical protein